jgi:hypothetical protein
MALRANPPQMSLCSAVSREQRAPPRLAAMTRKTHVHFSDLVGLNLLATDVTAELTDLAEALHNNIVCSPGIVGDRRVGWIWNPERRSAPAESHIPFHQVLADRRHFRMFIGLCRRLRHKETDADYQLQHNRGHDADRSFPHGRPHRRVSFRRRCSLSFMVPLKSASGRISIGPSPYLKPGSCETS